MIVIGDLLRVGIAVLKLDDLVLSLRSLETAALSISPHPSSSDECSQNKRLLFMKNKAY